MWHAMCIGPQSTHLYARFSQIASESLWSTSVASRLLLLTSVLQRWTSHGRTLESQASGNVRSGEALIDLRSQISSSQCCHHGHYLHISACPPRKRTLLHYLLHKPNRTPSWKSIIEKFRVRNAVLDNLFARNSCETKSVAAFYLSSNLEQLTGLGNWRLDKAS